MDTRRLITMMMISFAIIFGWQIFVDRVLYPMHPEWKKPGQATTQPATTAPAPVATTGAAPSTAQLTASPAASTSPVLSTAALRVISPATQPAVATIGNETDFVMIARVSSQG